MEKEMLLHDPEFLKKLIPSRTMRDYILETGWVPTDFQLAVLIFHMEMGVTREDKEAYWAAVARETKDQVLRGRLEEAVRSHQEPAFLEKMYVPLPNPFQRGEIVAMLDEQGKVRDYGLVWNTQEDWEAYHRQKRYWAYWDEALIVEYIDPYSGDFTHSHINPFYLERSEPEDKTILAYLRAGQELLQGKEGSIDWLFWKRGDYRKAHCKQGEGD